MKFNSSDLHVRLLKTITIFTNDMIERLQFYFISNPVNSVYIKPFKTFYNNSAN